MGYLRHGIVNGALIAALLVVWIVVAPQPMGGLAIYATVSGVSMNPLLQKGDVVVLRETESVGVGDVVAYRSESLNTIVVHRIVSEDQGLFTFKGDNNEWLDTDRSGKDAVLGKMWFKISGAGKFLDLVRQPWQLGLFAAGIVLVSGIFSGARRKLTKVDNKLLHRRPFTSLHDAGMAAVLTPTGQIAIGTTIVAAVLLVAVSVYAWRTPKRHSVIEPVAFSHHGSFQFHAPPPLPEISDRPLGNGDPIFVNLTPEVDTEFSYSFTADGDLKDLHGTTVIYGIVSNLNGWHQTAQNMEPVPFEGNTATISTTWDMKSIMDLIVYVEDRTKSSTRYYTAALVGEVHLTGTLDGQPFDETFTPLFHLRFNPPSEVYVETTATRVLEGVAGLPGSSGDEFVQQQHGSLDTTVEQEKVLSFRALHISIDVLRWVSSILSIVFFGALAVALCLVTTAQRQPEDFQIEARWGRRILNTPAPEKRDSAPPTQQLSRFEDLVHVSDVFGRLVLRQETESGNEYSVDGDGTRYVYRTHGLATSQ